MQVSVEFILSNRKVLLSEYEADEWEIDRADVIMTDSLGEGTFGIVYRGVLVKEGLPVDVAVKVSCI